MVEKLEECLQLVITVRAAAEDMQEQVELGRGGQDQLGVMHGVGSVRGVISLSLVGREGVSALAAQQARTPVLDNQGDFQVLAVQLHARGQGEAVLLQVIEIVHPPVLLGQSRQAAVGV